MSKEMSVIIVGLWITIVPFLGVPSSWRTTLVTISGLGVMLLGFLLRTQALSRGGTHDSSRTFTFVDNSDTADSPAHDRKEEITSLN